MQSTTVAAFDFDGTLTYRDTLFFFLLYTHGTLRTLANLTLLLPKMLSYLLGICARQEAKEAILKKFYKGMPIEQLRQYGQGFAKTTLNKQINPLALERLKWHLQQGHRCILISASLDVYLKPWAELNGMHDVISSHLQTTPEGVVTGKLLGLNCWGPEKTRRLYEMIGSRENFTLYAYGDSQGDKDLLQSADFPYYRTMPMAPLGDKQ